MDKRLQLHRAGGVHPGNLVQGHLPGQHHAGHPGFVCRAHPGGRMERHLGGRMHGHPRRARARQQKEAHILHKDGIHRQGAGVLQQFQRGQQLVLLQERIQSEIDLHPARMAVADRLLERLPVKILRIGAGAERGSPQIHRVRTGAHRCLQALRPSRRGQNLRGYIRFVTVHRLFSQRSS